MGSISDRLARLEDRVGMSPIGDGRAMTTREVLSRMSVAELRSYVNALRSMKGGERPGEEAGPILQRVEELYEGVTHEH
jgi:hypothetical protein